MSTGIDIVEEDGGGSEGPIDYQAQLNSIYQKIHEAEHLEDILWQLEQDLLTLINAERLTIYRKDKEGREIVSWYRTGDELMEEIVLPLSPSSIAGYVAMSQQEVRIDDVYDSEYLKSLHPKLNFDYSYDRSTGFLTTAMIVVPIKFKDTLLGVMQVINRRDGGAFLDAEYDHATEIAKVMGQKFRYDLKTTLGPYDLLIQNGKITLEELEELEEKAAENNMSVTQLLVKEAGIPVEELGVSLEQYFQVPFMKYDPEIVIDEEILENLNKSYLAGNCWVPLSVNQEKAVVLLDDPNDSERLMEIQNVLNVMSYEFLVGLKEDIMAYLGFELSGEEKHEEVAERDMGEILDELAAEDAELVTDDAADASGELSDPNASAIVALVNKIITDAYHLDTSDIHIEPHKGKTNSDVRVRVDGVNRLLTTIPFNYHRACIARIKVMANLDITENRKPQDGKIAVKLKGKPVELRVATLPTVNGESSVLRILAGGEKTMPYSALGLMPQNQKRLEELLTHPHGVFLVVGPTGSGKTTTLHAILGKLNTIEKKIVTAEDPVEITQAGLQQVQVMPKIGYTFAAAIRAFLRCGPDIILIGEMRDHETAATGIEASLTGHLVFSTLHTNSAPETITRLLDMDLDPLNFADAFIGVLAQRLMRTLCKACKEPYKPDQEEIERLIHIFGEEYFHELEVDVAELELNKAVGCEKCSGTGYAGRCGVHELLEATPEMKKLIAKKAPVAEMRTLAMSQGMRTLGQDGIYRIITGVTDLSQYHRMAGGGH